jgi:PAS domain S-box-containing protein
MLVSVIVLLLYFWAFFADVKDLNTSLLVSDSAAIFAGITLVAAFVSYLWTPRKYIFWGSYTAFVVLCITTSILIVNTGGTSSPFLALWMILSVFAGVFGLFGLLPLLVATGVYAAAQYLAASLGQETVVSLLLGSILPLIISYFIWHSKSAPQENGDKAYRELATELSQVAGKSEVVINAIADGVIALDDKGHIQLINPAAQQIIGWGKQDALSLDYKSVLKLVDKNNADLTTANDPVLQTLATNEEVITNDLTLVTNAGKKRMVSVVVSPIGQLGAGAIIVFRDITKEKAEEREKAEFISTASHEMRTPVASIEGYLGLALNPATAQIDEKARGFINKAHESVQHLGTLFQDLLDVTKAEDGRLSNNPKVVDVVAFTHDIVEGMRPQAEKKGLRMLYKPQPDNTDGDKGGERRISPVFYANVDNSHLREIIANLVDNAIKYTPSGDVVIDVNGDSEHITINVADSGIGIPKEDQVHLFQKFYRVDNSDTREIGGTGLGLYLCRRLAEAMSGRIWVESEFKKGSTFYLEIPRIDHEEAMRLIESASTEQTEITDVTPERPTLPMPASTPTVNASPQPAPAAPEPPTSIPPQPATQATATQPTQQQPYAPAMPVQPQPPAAQPAPTTPSPSPNVPLTSIEQHPDQYLQNRPQGVSVPPRR